MLMGDNHVVGFRHYGIVGLRLQTSDRVDVEVAAIVFNHDSGMLDTCKLDILAGRCLESVSLTLLTHHGQGQQSKEGDKQFFHVVVSFLILLFLMTYF